MLKDPVDKNGRREDPATVLWSSASRCLTSSAFLSSFDKCITLHEMPCSKMPRVESYGMLSTIFTGRPYSTGFQQVLRRDNSNECMPAKNSGRNRPAMEWATLFVIMKTNSCDHCCFFRTNYRLPTRVDMCDTNKIVYLRKIGPGQAVTPRA